MSRVPKHPALVGLVAPFWVSARPEADDQETVMPDGRAQVVIDGGGSILVGPRTRPSVIGPSKFAAGMSLSGVGLHALSRVPMHELLDEVVDAGDVWESEQWGRCLDTSEPSEILDRLETGSALVELGIPTEVILNDWEALVVHTDDIAARFVALFEQHLAPGDWQSSLDTDEARELAHTLARLQATARQVLMAALGASVARIGRERLGELIAP